MSELKGKAFKKIHKKIPAVQKAEGLKNNKAFLYKPLITLKLQTHFSTVLNLAFNAFKQSTQPMFRKDNKQSQMLVLGICLKVIS